jgi:hypothetical protein
MVGENLCLLNRYKNKRDLYFEVKNMHQPLMSKHGESCPLKYEAPFGGGLAN